MTDNKVSKRYISDDELKHKCKVAISSGVTRGHLYDTLIATGLYIDPERLKAMWISCGGKATPYYSGVL